MRLIILFLMITSSCNSDSAFFEKLSFLKGTWKVEGRENYETWNMEKTQLIGESYKMVEGKKIVSETLKIEQSQDQIIYTATVLNQNNGAGIPFTLNTNITDQLSFENPEHDFPNKIQYKKLSENEIFVSVLGKDGKGFSYKIIRQQ